jgi:hypothetical protein
VPLVDGVESGRQGDYSAAHYLLERPMAATELRISDLTRLEQLELEKQLGKERVRFESQKLPDDAHAELATATAIVIVSLAALRLVAQVVVRLSNRKRIRRTVELVAADGSIRRTVVEVDDASSGDAEAKVFEQLAKAADTKIG